jgi:hypothetical protein
MKPTFKEVWLDGFAAHLTKLQPWMNAVIAASHAVAMYPDAKGLPPNEAAEMFALEVGSHEDGAAEQRGREPYDDR